MFGVPTLRCGRSVWCMSDENAPEPSKSLEQDVLDELGDDRLQELAGLLGTDAGGAQNVVGTTVAALSGPEAPEEVQQAVSEAAPGDQPLQGVATLGGLGGLASGGLLAGVLSKMSRPVANAVSKKTGIPAANVARGIEMLIPVVLAVMSKRAATKKRP